jgi:hypothetical protein
MLTAPAPVPQEIAPLREHQLLLERLFNKNQTLTRIRDEFINCEEVDFEGYFNALNMPAEFGFNLLTQMALHKRATLPILVGILFHHFETAAQPTQACADMLMLAAEADLVDWDGLRKEFVVRFEISKDVQEEIDRFQYPLPMVIRPKKVSDNRDTGYLLTRGSIILRKNHHEDDVCLDHINRLNRTKFTINTDTAMMIANRWRNLDRPKEGESQQDFEKRVKAFEKYDRTAKDVIGLLTQHGNEFYLTHRYDKRGRTYCQGYHVNYQGAPWNKAVIELADKEIVP